jgi:hypothetical protein
MEEYHSGSPRRTMDVAPGKAPTGTVARVDRGLSL